MVGRYLHERYPEETNEDEDQPMGEGAPAYTVRYDNINGQTIKTYATGKRNNETCLRVWNAEFCRKKVIKKLATGEDEGEWLAKIENWAAAQKEKTQMEGQWAADCMKNLYAMNHHIMMNLASYQHLVDAASAALSEAAAPQEKKPSNENLEKPASPPRRLGLFNPPSQ